jgi:hypothetical protein
MRGDATTPFSASPSKEATAGRGAILGDPMIARGFSPDRTGRAAMLAHHAVLRDKITDAFWQALRDEGILHADAAVPS